MSKEPKDDSGVIRAALYVRVSTEEQKVHGLSIEAQTGALDEWARSNGVRVVDHYTDAGISARKKHDKRPEMVRLLNDVRSHKIDLIIFTKLDRWFRNVGEYYKVQEVLEENGVNWKTIHEDYDTSTSSGRLKINIMLSVAQDEADRTSERIKSVFDSKKQNMEPVTGHVPTGYVIEGKAISFDPKWYEATCLFFMTYLTSGSPATARKKVQERTGRIISYQLATLMLTNRAYYGVFHGIDGMCPAYITKEQYDRIQTMRKSQPRKALTGRVYLFSGLVYCKECGHRLSSCCRNNKRADGSVYQFKYYNCQHHYVRSACPNNSCTRESYIEEEVMRLLPIEVSRADLDFNTMREKATKSKVDIPKLRRKLSKLKDLYLNDLIDLDAYRKEYKQLQEELRAAEEIEKSVIDPAPLRGLVTPGWEDVYRALDYPEKRAFWGSIVDKIYVSIDKQVSLQLRKDYNGGLLYVK